MNPIPSIYAEINAYSKILKSQVFHSVCQAEDVISHLTDATSEDLVVFDVDEVLITAKDRFLRLSASEFSDPIFSRIFYPLTDENKVELFGKWISQVEVEVVNSRLTDALKETVYVSLD